MQPGLAPRRYGVLSERGRSGLPAVGSRHRHGSLAVTVTGGLIPSSMVNLVVSVVVSVEALELEHS
jgi:hypothetical protein